QTIPSYVLRVDAGVSKLLAASGEPFATQIVSNGEGTTIATNSDLKSISRMLTVWLGRPVVNQTGLDGKYNFTLNAALPNVAPEALVTLVRKQLGLDLQSTAAPVEVLVVDSIQKPTPDAPLTVKR